MTLGNYDSESSTLTAEKIREIWAQIQNSLQPLAEWLHDVAPMLNSITQQRKHRYLRNSKLRIQAIYWAKGHKHRLTRKELTQRGLTRRSM